MSAPHRMQRMWMSRSLMDGDSITWTAMIPAIVLAAGRSTRMGRAKAALPIGANARVNDRQETFLSRIVRTLHAGGASDVVVVLGHDADAIAAAFAPSVLGGLAARVIVNADYDRGQL